MWFFCLVGGVCTVEVARVSEMVRALGPRVVVPMHYALPGLVVQLGALDVFLKGDGGWVRWSLRRG